MAEKIRQIISQENIDMDVVITNEISSCAVALKYRRDIDDAPRIVAKSRRWKKTSLYTVARKHNIPIVENNPLAEYLYECSEGEYIPEDYLIAVAVIYSHVYSK